MKVNLGIRFVISSFLVFLCFSCGNEIKLFPDEIPSEYMVFGILDANSDQQYVKIRMTFGGNSDLIGMTSNPELFIPPASLEVRIGEFEEDGKVDYILQRDVMVKDPGIFSVSNNVIYGGLFKVKGGSTYQLEIQDIPSGLEIKSSTVAIDPPKLRFPLGGNLFNFADTVNPFYVKYEPTGSVHLQQFFINFAEMLHSGDTVFRTVRFDLNPRFKHPLRPVITYTRTYSKDYLLNIMRMLIKADENVAERQLFSFDIIIWAGDQYLKDYLQLSAKYNDHRRLFFSNIEGGLGLFAACSHVMIEEIYPRQQFFDTIARAERLKQLHFANRRFSGEFIKSKAGQDNYLDFLITGSKAVTDINTE